MASNGSSDTEWDIASHAVADVYFPHHLSPLTRSAQAHPKVSSVALGATVRMAHIGWGAEVSVDSKHEGAYAINIPLAGFLESKTAGHIVTSEPGTGTICPADTPTSITRWSETCSILGVRIERDYIAREIPKILGEWNGTLPGQVDLHAGNGRSWLKLVRSVYSDMQTGDGVWDNPVVAEQLAGALVTGFVLAALPDEALPIQAARPRIIKRVMDAMEADPARAWTAADMAEVAGVSVRRLQEGFRDYVGRTPRECLVDIRLTRVRRDLMVGSPDRTVADVALSWGFTHTGRFAALYRRKFGVTPSEQLRL